MVYLAADGRDRRVAAGATWLVVELEPDAISLDQGRAGLRIGARGVRPYPPNQKVPTPAASAAAAIDGLARLAGLKALQ